MLAKDADECCPMPQFRRSKQEKAKRAEKMGWVECHMTKVYCPFANEVRKFLDEKKAFRDKMYADLLAKGISLDFAKEHVDEKMIWNWLMEHMIMKGPVV